MDDFRQYLQPPKIDPPSKETIEILKDITPKEWKRNPIYQAELKKAIATRKRRQQQARWDLWWSKGIQILNLILALIAAVTGIIALLR